MCPNGAEGLPPEMCPNEFLRGNKKEEKVAELPERILWAAVALTTNFWGVWGVVKHARTTPPAVETSFTHVPSSRDGVRLAYCMDVQYRKSYNPIVLR